MIAVGSCMCLSIHRGGWNKGEKKMVWVDNSKVCESNTIPGTLKMIGASCRAALHAVF